MQKSGKMTPIILEGNIPTMEMIKDALTGYGYVNIRGVGIMLMDKALLQALAEGKGGYITTEKKEWQLKPELQAVFDPKGGYFKVGGKFMPSIIAEIGDVIEHHMQKIGLMAKEELSEQQKLILNEKRAEVESAEKKTVAETAGEETGYPASATLCNKCYTKAVVVMDNCATCLSCGYSKCG